MAAGTAPALRGPIASDTVWEGRVAVDGIVAVEPGATLTIRPGTEVRFAPEGGLNVAGTLLAEGQGDKPIRFLPAVEGQAPWAGIELSNVASPSRLRACRLVGARGISVWGGAHRVEGCELSGGVFGVAVEGPDATPVITGNRIADMSDAGIRCIAKSGPEVTQNVLERCGKVGIGAQPGAVPQIRGNRVSECETGIDVSQTPPRVSGNTVNNCAVGIMLNASSGGEPVTGNRVEGNEVGIACQLSSGAEISGNVVVRNQIGISCLRHSRPVVRANDVLENDTGIACSQFSDPTVTANTIARNGRGLFLTNNSFAAVHGNNFEDNPIQVESVNMSHAYEQLNKNKPLRGLLQQNRVQVERGMAAPLTTKDDGLNLAGRPLDLSGNWWGEAATRELQEKGADANLEWLVDGRDHPEIDGFAQEKIVYAPWATQRVAATGVQAP